jgi:hypothetical protein
MPDGYRSYIWAGLALIGLLIGGCKSLGAQPTMIPSATPTAQLTQGATRGTSQPGSPTNTTLPTLAPAVTRTSTQTPTPCSTSTPLPTPTSTPAPPPATPTPTWIPSSPSPTPVPPTATPLPTLVPSPLPPAPTPSAYRFLPAGPASPDPSHPCPGCPKAPAYIVGHVSDAGGHPLAGVRLVCYNEWHRYPVVASKGGGEYDFPIIQADTTWYVVVLSQADEPISPEVPVSFSLQESCRYILDWRRVD